MKVAMQNPHTHFYVEAVGADGRAVTWDSESTSLNWLQRTKVSRELLRTRSRVKFAGWPSKRPSDRMYSLKMLAEDGSDILSFRSARPRSQPPPLEFVDRGEMILLHLEEYDTVRTIHMAASGNPDVQPRTPLGYSVGRWEGNVLVVETNRLDSPYLIATVGAMCSVLTALLAREPGR